MSVTSLPRAKGGSFFSAIPERVFTPEDFAGDEALMIQMAEEFARKEVLPLAERLEKQEPGLMPDLVRRAAALGFCGVDAPEAYGGLGLSKNLAARILEYMSQDASFSVTYGITCGISVAGLALFGTEDQKRRYLPKIVSGEWIGAYALSEPNSGSDALSATTRAVPCDGGYRLTGTKMWISNAQWADLFTVFAKVNGDQFTGFLIERDTPGLLVEREEHKLGLKGSSTARLVLSDTFVPEVNVLHEVGKGHQVAFNALNLGRFKLASMSLGPARDTMTRAAQYARERKQFGRPIAEFGLIRQKFAEMAARFYAAESCIYRTGALIDQAFAEHAGTVDGNRKACEEFAIECSLCKVLATEAEAFIVDESLQVYGGYGFSEEFPAARHYRDARVSRIYEGTNEINRAFIADRMRRKGLLESAGDSFISELAGRAMRAEVSDQVRQGAQADLAMLTYAEQSARLRALQTGNPLHRAASDLFRFWANGQAARAHALVTGESVMVPAMDPLPSIEALGGVSGPV